jgi:hypothetical protein
LVAAVISEAKKEAKGIIANFHGRRKGMLAGVW